MGNSKVFAATFIASGFVQQMPFAFLGISQAGLLCHTVGQTEYEFVTKIVVVLIGNRDVQSRNRKINPDCP